jgi:hypothetical protein
MREYVGTFDPAWLELAETVDEYFARELRHIFMRRASEQKRTQLEAELSADRAIVDAALQPADELRPWLHWFDPGGPPSGARGVAILREGRVVKAWCTHTAL